MKNSKLKNGSWIKSGMTEPWPNGSLTCYISLGLMLLTTACTVGPDFHHPEPISVKTYSVESHPMAESGSSLHYTYNKTLPQKWWQLFNSTQLNNLIQDGLKHNQNLAAAQATIRAARANFNAVTGSELPQVGVNAAANITRFDPAAYGIGAGVFPSTDFVLYNASVSVAYNLDLFGGLKRQAEASAAYVAYQAYQLQAAELTLSANITTAVFKIAMLNEEIDATNAIINAQESILKIAREQLKTGGIAMYDVNNLEKDLLQTKASLPGLIKSQEQTKHLLAIYLGKAPAQIDFSNFKLQNFKIVEEIPLLVPAKLAYQRPDILSAIALLHQASANVGVATANLYPSFSISGSGGPIATQQSWNAFSAQGWIWSVGPSLNLPIFNGGTLQAEKKAAIAELDNATANYRETVLIGLQNVADCLSALDLDNKTLITQVAYYKKSMDNLAISQKQFNAGGISVSQLLNVEILANLALINKLQTQGMRLSDTSALFQSLGGGWWKN